MSSLHHSSSGNGTAYYTPQLKRPKTGGFALVIALSLMAFVLLLLLSISTLVQVETRSADTQKEKLEAQQNALLGLKMALGDLQKLSGSDQRITASAEIFDTDASTGDIEGVTHPNWVGVWDSDPGLTHLNDRLNTTDPYYNYNARRDGSDNRFLGWLVSGNQNNITDHDAAITADNQHLIYGTDFDDTDPRQVANQVRVEKMPITKGSTTAGNYAYWVSDENTKARIDAYELVNTTVPIADVERSRFIINQRNAIEKVASQGDVFSSLTGDSEQDAINAFTSPNDLNFILGNTDDVQTSLQQNALTLTSSAYSLLTDSYSSGLKTDLSTLLRQGSLSTALDNGIPTYTNGDDSHAIARYPADAGSNLAPESATWEQLQSYATTTVEPFGNAITARKHSATEHGYYPIVTRYRLNIVPVLVKDEANDILNYHIEPVVVLNNPYNASLRLSNDMHVQLYFEKRDLAANRGIRISNSFVKWDPAGRYQSFGNGEWGGTDLFENNDLITYTDSNGIEYVGFTFKLPAITLAPGEVTTLGVANDGSIYTGSNLLEQGAYDTGTSNVIMTHKDASGTIFHSNLAWANIIETKMPQGALQINVDTPGIQQSVVNTTNPKTGGQIHVKLLPFKMAIGLSDQEQPTQLDDFYHLAQGFECSVPNGQMRTSSSTDQKYDRNGVLKVNSLYDYNAMTSRAVNFDIVMAGGFEYPDNDIRGGIDSCASGFRINNRWLIGHNFRAPHHAPAATDHTDYAPNTLYGGVAGYQPWAATGDRFHHTAVVEMDNDGKAFWGTGIDSNGESTNTFFDLPSPTLGILSLAQLQHMQIDPGRLFKDDNFEEDAPNAYLAVDQSFLINNALWDSFFFSGLSTDVTTADLSSWQAVPLNNRYEFSATATPTEINDPTRTSEALYVRGGFNINSTKKEAWKAVLAGANTLNIDPADTGNSIKLQSPISRSSFPSQASGDSYAERLNGFRELSDAELDSLAANIVEVIKTRGPFLSLSDFVNRRIQNGNTTVGLYGTLEAAIQAPEDPTPNINDNRITTTSGPLDQYTEDDQPKWVTQPADYITELFEGPRGEGISQWITQADLLQRIAPVINARSDTFTIRAYGESIDPISGESVSTATCEASVQRIYDYTDDTGNTPDHAATVFNNATEAFEAGNLTALNQQFGRRYKIVSLKWL